MRTAWVFLAIAAVAAFATGRYAAQGDWAEAIAYGCVTPLWAVQGIARLR